MTEDCTHCTLEQTDARANRLWIFDSAPAPIRFLRKQTKRTLSPEDAFLASKQPTIADLQEDIWAFQSSTCSHESTLKFYTAHRQYIAREIASSSNLRTDEGGQELWEMAVASSMI